MTFTITSKNCINRHLTKAAKIRKKGIKKRLFWRRDNEVMINTIELDYAAMGIVSKIL